MPEKHVRGAKLAAKVVNRSERTVRRWIQKGLLPAAKPGGVTSPFRIARNDLLRLRGDADDEA